MKIKGTDKQAVDSAFADELVRRSGENVYLCYQCRKCASGCPCRTFVDHSPTELMRMVQLGMKDKAMENSLIWSCLSCQTCSARCPQGIDIAHVVDTLKIMAQEEKHKVDSKNVKPFNTLWMTMLKHMGRIYEVGLVGGLNMAMKHPLKGIGLAGKMVRRGKLRFLPTFKRSSEMKQMFKRAEGIKQRRLKQESTPPITDNQ